MLIAGSKLGLLIRGCRLLSIPRSLATLEVCTQPNQKPRALASSVVLPEAITRRYTLEYTLLYCILSSGFVGFAALDLAAVFLPPLLETRLGVTSFLATALAFGLGLGVLMAEAFGAGVLHGALPEECLFLWVGMGWSAFALGRAPRDSDLK